MAIGVVPLTRRKRFLCALLFLILTAIQFSLGVVTVIWAVYICRVISPTLVTEQVEISFLFTVIAIFGTHIAFHALAGIQICRKCYKQAQKKSTRSALFIWTLIGCNLLVDIYLLASRGNAVSKHVTDALRRSLEYGMENYLKDPYWKETIDYVQTNNECCGLTGYKTWYNIIWLDENQLKMDDPLVKELRLSQTRPEFPVAPWSCCDINYPLQCLHDPFQQMESSYLWKEEPALVEQSLYTDGCITVLIKPVQRATNGFIVITWFLFILMVFSILVSRLLYTSSRNNIILQHSSQMAPGWIFGRGDWGWSYGPTLDQVMEKILSRSSALQKKNSVGSRSRSSLRTADQKYEKLSNFSKMIHKKRKSRGEIKKPAPKSDEEPVSSGEEKVLMIDM